jgi:hypothetical protein
VLRTCARAQVKSPTLSKLPYALNCARPLASILHTRLRPGINLLDSRAEVDVGEHNSGNFSVGTHADRVAASSGVSISCRVSVAVTVL